MTSARSEQANDLRRIPAVVVGALGMALILGACRLGGGESTASASAAASTSVAPSPSAGMALRGTVTAGPTCPVERDPPDPSCAPRPVADARITVQDADGREVVTAVSDSDGHFVIMLEPGRYRLIPEAIGRFSTAPAVDVEILPGIQPKDVAIDYDTGIR